MKLLVLILTITLFSCNNKAAEKLKRQQEINANMQMQIDSVDHNVKIMKAADELAISKLKAGYDTATVHKFRDSFLIANGVKPK